MHKRDIAALRKALAPMIVEISELFTKAMVLRVDVHLTLAFDSGAENEDIPEIIASALESALPLTSEFFSSLAEVDRADAFTKSKGG